MLFPSNGATITRVRVLVLTIQTMPQLMVAVQVAAPHACCGAGPTLFLMYMLNWSASSPLSTGDHVPNREDDLVAGQLAAEMLAAKEREIKSLRNLVERMEAHCQAMAGDGQKTIDIIMDTNRKNLGKQKQIIAPAAATKPPRPKMIVKEEESSDYEAKGRSVDGNS